MKNLNVSPEQMTVICNIQMMWDKVGISHDQKDFNNLCKLSLEELQEKQDTVIKMYNQSFKTK